MPQHRNLPLSGVSIPAQTRDGLTDPILHRIELNFPMACYPEQSNETNFRQFERHDSSYAHTLRMSRLEAWLNSSDKSPAEQALKVRLREELARTGL